MRQRLRHRILGLLVLALLTSAPGCMSYLAHVGGPSGLEGPPAPYTATKVDLQLATAPLWVDEGEDRFDVGTGVCMLLGTVDFPLTAMLDTACLPVDFVRTMQADRAGTSRMTADE